MRSSTEPCSFTSRVISALALAMLINSGRTAMQPAALALRPLPVGVSGLVSSSPCSVRRTTELPLSWRTVPSNRLDSPIKSAT
ncbi:hypothetical protein D3C72_2317330 [compost metagenome]